MARRDPLQFFIRESPLIEAATTGLFGWPVVWLTDIRLSLSTPTPDSAAMVVRCPHCPAMLASDEELQEHSSQHLGPESSAFSCSLCPRLCPSQQQLQEHYLTCHVDRPVEQEDGGGGEVAQEEEGAFIKDEAVRTFLVQLLAHTNAVLSVFLVVLLTQTMLMLV